MTLDDFSGAADAFRRGRGVDREGFTERHVDYQYNEGLSDLHLGRHGEARLRFSQALALVDEASAAEAVTASATAEAAASTRGIQELHRIDSAVGGERAVQSIPAVQILSVLAVACMHESDYNDALAFLLRGLDVNTTIVDAGGNASSGGGGVDCGAYDDDEEKVVGGLDEGGESVNEGSHDEKDEEDDEDEDGVGGGEGGEDGEDREDEEDARGSIQDGPRNAKSTTIDSSGDSSGDRNGSKVGRAGVEGATGSEGGDLSVVFNLAVCHLRLGMLDEALTWFRRAATLAPFNKQADAAVAMLEARLEARVEATRPKTEPGRTVDDGGGSGGGGGGGGGGGFSGGYGGGGGGGDTAGERLYDEGFGGINSSRVNASSGGTEDTEDTEDADDDVRPSMNGDAVAAGMPRRATSTSSGPNGDAFEEDDAEKDEEEGAEGESAFAMFAKGGWGMDILPMDPVFLRRPSLHELKVGCSRHSSFGSRSIGASGAPGTSAGTPGGSLRNVVLTPNGSP